MSKELHYLQYVNYRDLHNWSVQSLSAYDHNYNDQYPLVRIGDFLRRNRTAINLEDDQEYKRVTIRINNGGVLLRDTEFGKNIGTKRQYLISEGQFLLSKIDARNGAFGVVTNEIDGAIITGNFWTYDVDYNLIDPHFLTLITTTDKFIEFCEIASHGTTNRRYLQEKLFLDQKIPLPTLMQQSEILEAYEASIDESNNLKREIRIRKKAWKDFIFSKIAVPKIVSKSKKAFFKLVNYSKISTWSVNQLDLLEHIESKQYPITNLEISPHLATELFRGKSPKYDQKSGEIILNQQCNRWNAIEIEHARTVNKKWLESYDEKFFTKENDVLINSTGEGTIGRASLITKEFAGYLYDSHLLLLRLNPERIDPRYFVFLFNSLYGQFQVENIKSAQTTKQTELGIGNLKKIFIPILPIMLQKQIAAHLQKEEDAIIQLEVKAKKLLETAQNTFEKTIFN